MGPFIGENDWDFSIFGNGSSSFNPTINQIPFQNLTALGELAANATGNATLLPSDSNLCEFACPMEKVNQVYENFIKCFTADIVCCTCIFFIGMGMVEAIVNEVEGPNNGTVVLEPPRL